jgi:23S rRNA G2445 N2-methylase RlmL
MTSETDKKKAGAESLEAAIICPRGAVRCLIEELAELGIQAKEAGTDWARARLSEEQEDAVIRKSLLASKIMRLIATSRSAEELVKLASEIKPIGSFAVRADGPDRQQLQEDIGGSIKDGSGATVNLTKPDTAYFVHDDAGELALGQQIGGELGKRHYKIITGPFSLAGPVAAAVNRLSGWNGKDDLVVWPCATGELAIEASFRVTGKSPRAYELKDMSEKDTATKIVAADPRLPMVSSAQKNAKIAGVEKRIRFSRQDLDWLDTKHDENKVKYMIGILPNLRLAPKMVGELFYQLDFILAPTGTACFVCVNDDSARMIEEGAVKAERKYAMERKYVWTGQQALCMLLITSEKRKTQKKKV